MNKSRWAYVCLGLSINAVAAEVGVSLEGISILGAQRYAFVSYKNQSFRVAPNDQVDDWLVVKIEPRAIFVRNVKDEKGVEQKIDMDNVTAEPLVVAPQPLTPAAPVLPMPTSAGLPEAKPAPAFQPRVIKDEDIPPGHRRVRTPFGDVLVKDENAK